MRIILWDYLKDAEEIMTKGALATRSDKIGPEIDISEKQISKMMKITKLMKLSSVLDFGYYIVSIEGVSRSFTHQWVRYRIAAHMQQSLRYVKIDTSTTNWFVIPPEITKKGVETIIKYIKSNLNSGRVYLELISRGVPPEDARFALPIGVKTHISSAFDPEELIHIIYQRTCFDAQWEIRAVAYALLLAGLIVHPNIFDGVGPPCIYIGEEKCRGSGGGKCMNEAKSIVDKIHSLARQLRQQYLELKQNDKLTVDLTDILGYRAPKQLEDEISRVIGSKVDLSHDVILEIYKR